MSTACTIDFDNSENGSFRLICSNYTNSDINWLYVFDSNDRSAKIAPGSEYSVSDMYYNWYIIAEAVPSNPPYSEYKIIGVFTKNSDYLVGIFLTANGYQKLEMGYGEITTVTISDLENAKINNEYNCIFNTANDIDVTNSEETKINIFSKVLNYNLSGQITYTNNNTCEIQIDEGIIKYIFNLTNDTITDSSQSVVENYEISFGNMVIIFNSVTNEICSIIVADKRTAEIYIYIINNHNIMERPGLTHPDRASNLKVNEVDIQGYYTVDVKYPTGADIDITNTEA